jgi:hypothetical protein
MSLSISNFFQTMPFLIAFTIGILYVYLFSGRPEVIIKYPTPDNAHNYIFKDDAENCYRFHTEEVQCPSNPLAIKNIPIQRKVETFKNQRKQK